MIVALIKAKSELSARLAEIRHAAHTLKQVIGTEHYSEELAAKLLTEILESVERIENE